MNFFTDNDDFYGKTKKEQDPLSAVQVHVIHTFKNRIWATASVGYDWGGESTINGVKKDDEKENLYFSISTGYPISQSSSIKLVYVGSRTKKEIGADSDYLILALAFRF